MKGYRRFPTPYFEYCPNLAKYNSGGSPLEQHHKIEKRKKKKKKKKRIIVPNPFKYV